MAEATDAGEAVVKYLTGNGREKCVVNDTTVRAILSACAIVTKMTQFRSCLCVQHVGAVVSDEHTTGMYESKAVKCDADIGGGKLWSLWLRL